MAAIDITIPRECIYKEFETDPGPCPRCNGQLQQGNQTYMVTTRQGRRDADSFIIGSDFGWFCPTCPSVVINPSAVHNLLGHGKPDWNTGPEFAVMGVIDLDAVPPEKQDIPLGDDDNPIPLIQFTKVSSEGLPFTQRLLSQSKSSSRKKRPKPARLQTKQRKKKKKRRRN